MESAAILTIKDAGKMTKKGRKQIAKWLMHEANMLEEIGDCYSKVFRSRYLFDKGESDV